MSKDLAKLGSDGARHLQYVEKRLTKLFALSQFSAQAYIFQAGCPSSNDCQDLRKIF